MRSAKLAFNLSASLNDLPRTQLMCPPTSSPRLAFDALGKLAHTAKLVHGGLIDGAHLVVDQHGGQQHAQGEHLGAVVQGLICGSMRERDVGFDKKHTSKSWRTAARPGRTPGCCSPGSDLWEHA
eukprot:1160389-Pelagomonas_calceolata.AAC.12